MKALSEEKSGGLLWKAFSGLMLVASIGAVAVILLLPHPKQLELPSAVHVTSSEQSVYMRDVCIEGVLYTKSFGLPESAVVGVDGKAQECSGGHPNFAGLGHRFRLVCRDGVEYVKMRTNREDGLFVRYDTDTQLPRRCGA